TVTAFVVFRADSMAHAAGVLTDMFNIKAGNAAVNNEVFALISPLFVVSFMFAVLLSAPVFRKIEAKMADSDYSEGCMIAEYACSLLIYVLCILSLSSGSYNPFIYFRF
ncbi:MAG: hypothetical protein IKM72_03795, partial [Oscillospiraceae bacterium]|nr:hypothetical protein [Oscillospiraceae bacterium]